MTAEHKKITSERIFYWLSIATFAGSILFQIVKGNATVVKINDTPGRIDAIAKELDDKDQASKDHFNKIDQAFIAHCASQTTFESDLKDRLERIERKIDRIAQ